MKTSRFKGIVFAKESFLPKNGVRPTSITSGGGISITRTGRGEKEIFVAKDEKGLPVQVLRAHIVFAPMQKKPKQICLVCVEDPYEGVLICHQVRC